MKQRENKRAKFSLYSDWILLKKFGPYDNIFGFSPAYVDVYGRVFSDMATLMSASFHLFKYRLTLLAKNSRDKHHLTEAIVCIHTPDRDKKFAFRLWYFKRLKFSQGCFKIVANNVYF